MWVLSRRRIVLTAILVFGVATFVIQGAVALSARSGDSLVVGQAYLALLLVAWFVLLSYRQRFAALEIGYYGLFMWPLLHVPVVLFGAATAVGIGVLKLSLQILLFLSIPLLIRYLARTVDDSLHVVRQVNRIAAILAVTVIHSWLFPDLYAGIGEVILLEERRRAFGVIGDQAGWIMAISAPMCLVMRQRIAFVVVLLGLLCTAQVGAFAVTVIGVVVVVLVQNRASISAVIRALAVMAVAGATVLFNETLHARLTAEVFEDAGSVFFRLYSMTNGVSLFLERPLLGQGFGAQGFLVSLGIRVDPIVPINYQVNSANQWLQCLVDFGLLGSAGLGLLLIFVLYGAASLSSGNVQERLYGAVECRAALAALVAFGVFNQSAVWFAPSLTFLILVAYFSSVLNAILIAGRCAADAAAR